MQLRQKAAEGTRLGDASPINPQQMPADAKSGGAGLQRASGRSAVAAIVSDLPGGSFAFVMATGIVSIAAMLLGRGEVAAALFAINLIDFRSFA